MRRREFIAGLGAAAWPLGLPQGFCRKCLIGTDGTTAPGGWPCPHQIESIGKGLTRGSPLAPVVARGQQAERVRLIGVLLPAAADDAVFQTWVGAFLQGLALSGWTIGRNVRIDTRWATAKAAEIRRHAAELVALAPDLILAHGTSAVAALLQPPRTVPIVFATGSDPVGGGYVESLLRGRAGATQADRAKRNTGGGPSGCHSRLGNQRGARPLHGKEIRLFLCSAPSRR